MRALLRSHSASSLEELARHGSSFATAKRSGSTPAPRPEEGPRALPTFRRLPGDGLRPLSSTESARSPRASRSDTPFEHEVYEPFSGIRALEDTPLLPRLQLGADCFAFAPDPQLAGELVDLALFG